MSTALSGSSHLLPIAAAFVRKLYRMLTVENPTVVSWSSDGRAFSIFDEERFEEHVLPRYFRGRLGLFLQNLDEHGFTKIASQGESRATVLYAHKHFVRGDPSRLNLVVRTQPAKRWRSRRRKPTVELVDALSDGLEVPPSANPSNCERTKLPDLSMLLDFTDRSANANEDESQIDGSMKNNEALAQTIAQHVVDPYASSAAMLTSDECISHKFTESALFTREMMESMVAWLDATA